MYYDEYSRKIYEWLLNTFYPDYQEQISSILSGLADIVTFLRYGLYLGVFAFLLWVAYAWLRPHLLKV